MTATGSSMSGHLSVFFLVGQQFIMIDMDLHHWATQLMMNVHSGPFFK